jgi:hypothetical protein
MMKAPVPGSGVDTAGEVEEGGSFAREFLARVAAGTSGPDDLVSVVAFMHSGPMLHGFCAVLFHTLRQLLTQGGGQ